MRLIIEGFTHGLVEEDVVTRMGLTRLGEGLTTQELRISDCPATDINAMDFYTKFALNKISGREYLNTTPWQNSAIIRMYQWQSSAGLEFALTFSCASGAASAAIATVKTSGGVTSFTSVNVSGDALSGWAPAITDVVDATAYAGSAVITYGGGNMPLVVYTGSTYIAPILGTNIPSGAKTVVAWGSYLFAGNILVDGVRQKSRIVWNLPLQGSSWSASDYMDLDSGDGDSITAMWLLKDVIVVFKRYKTFVVRYVGGVLQFDWERMDNSVGCVGPNAICESDGLLYFVGPDGFYSFDGVSRPKVISSKIERGAGRINSDVDYTSEVDSYDEKNQLFFLIADGSSERKNLIYIYDLENQSWSKWGVTVASLSSIVYGAILMLIDFPDAYETYSDIIGDSAGAKDSFLAFGTYDGKLQRYGNSDNDLGEAIDAYWVSPWIDCGYPDKNKRITRVTVFLDATGEFSYDLTFTVYKDWNDITEVVSETFNTSGYQLDIAEKKIDFTLPCRAFKFKIGVNQLNATVTIHKIVIEFLIKGKTLVS